MSDESCGNCGAQTENEPLVLCDECNASPVPAPCPTCSTLRERVRVLERLLARVRVNAPECRGDLFGTCISPGSGDEPPPRDLWCVWCSVEAALAPPTAKGET